MILTNKYKLPDQLVKVIQSKLYEPHSLGENRFSVTELIGPPLIRTLKAKYWNEIIQDVSDFLWMLLGTAVDNILSDFDTDVIAQHKIEQNVSINGKEVIVVGKPDVIRGDTIEDWKVTCLPLSAQILTQQGWKHYNEVQIGEKVLSYNQQNDRTEWVSLEHINVFQNANLWEIKNHDFSVKCTPNHKWFIRSRSSCKGKSYYKYKLKKTKDLKTHEQLILAAPCFDKGTSIISDNEAAILGWIITDGWFNWKRSQFCISQSLKANEPFCREIEKLVEEYVTSSWVKKDKVKIWRLSSPKMKELFKKAGISELKDFPAFVCKLSYSARAKMLDAMHKAEGNKKDNAWGVKNTIVFDTYQILATLQGGRLTKCRAVNTGIKLTPTYYTRVLRDRFLWLDNRMTLKMGPTNEKTAVWSPTTKNNSWVAKYNGEVFITGNSVWSFMNNDVKPEWEAQLNCYAYLRSTENVFSNEKLIKHLTINAILRDFVGYKSFEKDYPDVAFKCMPVKLWSIGEQEKYIRERLSDHLNNPLRECTPEEKWQKDTVYVLRKNGVKKAALASYPGSGGKQKFTSESDLLTIANGKGLIGGKYYVEKRLGECTRCKHYCPVAEMCKYVDNGE